jgi:hypothetical protein
MYKKQWRRLGPEVEGGRSAGRRVSSDSGDGGPSEWQTFEIAGRYLSDEKLFDPIPQIVRFGGSIVFCN